MIACLPLCTFTESILKNLSLDLKKCIVLGAFDGRSSIDINKATGDIRYIVLDCGNNDSMDILSGILSQLGIRYREDIKPGMWVRFQGDKWNISTLGEYSFKRTYLGLKASIAKGVSG